MTLQAGRRLGPYEVLSLVGAGGMGEVYRARDTRLDRTVALKVLGPDLAGDPEFQARFTREAKAISALNHSHICALYDVGREHDLEYLVLELLDGETLSARLARGRLPLTQVLRYGIEIADALEAAHRHGIMHRDLKPENVMLTRAGVKLLDFGLAKATVQDAPHALSMLATSPGTGTAKGVVLGTLPYMAPEQVQGQVTDARTDIFALGAMLYEMTTGRRAFEAMTQASLIAKILETEPPTASSIVPLTPPALDLVIQNCLAKVPADRWQTAHDVKLQLEWIRAQGSHPQLSPVSSRTAQKLATEWLWRISLFAAGAVLAAALVTMFRDPVPPMRPVRVDLSLAPYSHIESAPRGSISPDGQLFVFEAFGPNTPFLALKDLASSTIEMLPGTEGGSAPFWAPDSRSFAFFHPDNHLKQLTLAEREVRDLAETRHNGLFNSGTWHDNTILFTADDGRLYQVASTGGSPAPVSLWPNAKQPIARWARFLPDGRRFLVWQMGDPAVYVASLDGSTVTKILEVGDAPAYGAGYLLYSRGVASFARAFDPDRLQFSGPEVQLPDQMAVVVSIADNGTIAYSAAPDTPSTLTWFDRKGSRSVALTEPAHFAQVVLSPKGHHAMVVKTNATETDGDLWDLDLTTGVLSRVTTTPGFDTDPSWSRDEHAVAFTSARGAQGFASFMKDLVSGKETPLATFSEQLVVDQWTPDGRFVIARTLGKAVYAVPLDGKRMPQLLIDTTYQEDEVHVSPDGRWVAYNADESGRWEVYVAAFPSFTSRRQVSVAGGVQPQWRADGRELFYLASDHSMMSVAVELSPTLSIGRPSRLFSTRLIVTPNTPQYAVTPDGQRFLAIEQTQEPGKDFTFLINWLRPTGAGAGKPRGLLQWLNR